MAKTAGEVVVEIDGRQLKLTNLDKVLYPDVAFTKAEVIDYYRRIAPAMLPHVRDRPLTLKRYPNGVHAKYFYEKNCPSHAPDWVTRTDFPSRSRGTINFCLLNDLPTLIWLANLAALELHPLLSVADAPDCPTQVVFDLDPGEPAGFRESARIALYLRDLFDDLGFRAFAKSSGSKGVHVSVPLDGSAPFEVSKAFAEAVARQLVRAHPDEVTANMSKAARPGKVFVDWSQNSRHKSTVAVYSLRAKDRPTVAAPVSWPEVEATAHSDDPAVTLLFEAGEVVDRYERDGDLNAGLVDGGYDLGALRSAIDAIEANPDGRTAHHRLHEYRRKRDFHQTPEPDDSRPSRGLAPPAPGRPSTEGSGDDSGPPPPSAAGPQPHRGLASSTPNSRSIGDASPLASASLGSAPADALRFVIQQHDATRLHWDLRLEHDGVLPSWALPRGVPWSPKDNRLAVHTEDHPLEYLDFHGHIPDGNYGAGDMVVFDRGWYEPVEFEENKVVAVLHGDKVRGRYSLFQTRGRDWMIHRMDPPEDPDRRPIPDDLRPMSAVPGSLPDDAAGNDSDWAYEICWRGERVLLRCEPGRVEIVDERGRDVGARFPEVRRIHRATGAHEVVLDGVIASRADGGAPSPDDANVRERLDGDKPMAASTLKRREQSRPVVLVLFDVLWREGHPIVDRTYEERRDVLDGLQLDKGSAWIAPAFHRGDGEAMLAAAGAQGLPGLVAKRLDSTYEPGETTASWISVAAAG